MTTFSSTLPRPVSISSSRSRIATFALWIAQIAAAALFLFAGSHKLTGDPLMVQVFELIGVGQWFRYATGSIEVVAAVLLLVPRLAVFGALLLVPTMVGALITHAVIGGSPVPALALLVVTAVIVWARRQELGRVLSLAG